jgi:hypothetical protein
MSSIFAGILGVILGYLLTLRRERWSFKRELYSKLLENLGEVKYALGRLEDLDIRAERIQDELYVKWKEEAREIESRAVAEIRRVTAVAKMMLRKEALEALERLQRDWDEAQKADTYFEHIDQRGAAANKAYDLLSKAAKRELWM